MWGGRSFSRATVEGSAVQVTRDALTTYLKTVQRVLTAAADREAAAAVARLTPAASQDALRGQDASAGAGPLQGVPVMRGFGGAVVTRIQCPSFSW